MLSFVVATESGVHVFITSIPKVISVAAFSPSLQATHKFVLTPLKYPSAHFTLVNIVLDDTVQVAYAQVDGAEEGAAHDVYLVLGSTFVVVAKILYPFANNLESVVPAQETQPYFDPVVILAAT